jgi:hypothetical protein
MYSLRELAAVALLVRPGLSLVPTQIFGYLQTGQFPRANALNVVSLVLPALLVGCLYVVRSLVRIVRHRTSLGPVVSVGAAVPALGQGALVGRDAARGGG